MEAQRLWIVKIILRKIQLYVSQALIHTILQIYSNQNSIAVAEKQIHRSMEQNWKPRNKLMYI